MLGRWWVGGCEARAGVGACKFRQQISSRPDANIVQHVPQQPAAATNRPFLSLPTSLSGILFPVPAPPLRHHNHREAGHVIDSLGLRSTRFLCAVVRSSLSRGRNPSPEPARLRIPISFSHSPPSNPAPDSIRNERNRAPRRGLGPISKIVCSGASTLQAQLCRVFSDQGIRHSGQAGRRHIRVSSKIPLGIWGDCADLVYHSEVYRATCKRTGKQMALKKIIMHNEKDGVSWPRRLPLSIMA